MTEVNPVKVGVVGLGRIGWSHHVQQLLKHPSYKIVACVDLLEDRRKEAEAATGCATFDSPAKFFKSGLAELAIICTRSIDHCPHTLAALKAGLHVLVREADGHERS